MVYLASNSVYAKDIKRLDRNSADLGIPPQMLMECAGLQATNQIVKQYHLDDKSQVVIFAGTGNNGGDGMVIARHLATRGIKVMLILCGSPLKIRTPEAKLNWGILQNLSLNLTLKILADSSDIKKIGPMLSGSDIILDAMLGTGVRGKIREPISSVIDLLNSQSQPVVVIDVNTGRDPDSGEISDKAVNADLRITFHRDKMGLEGDERSIVMPIGTPLEAHLFVGLGDLQMALPQRPKTAHKGQYGKLLVIGGSNSYSGAPSLASLAALALGLDLVITFVPQSICNAVRCYSPNLIVRAGKETNLSPSDVDLAKQLSKWADVVLIGPGLGRSKETAEFFNLLYPWMLHERIPHVIDADGIYFFAQIHSQYRDLIADNQIVITPHKSELQQLISLRDYSPKMSLIEQANLIKSQLKDLSINLLFKGPVDIIVSQSPWDSLDYRFNNSGCPEMAVGGTGDVLAGLVASLMTLNNDPFLSACVGAYLNGKLGESVVLRQGNRLSAMDLIREIPPFLKSKNKNL